MNTFEESAQEIEALKNAGDKAGLRQCLTSSDVRIQSKAIEALATLRDATSICAAFPHLGEFAKTTAVECLGSVADPVAGPLLRNLAADATLDSYTRDALAKALGAIGGDDGIEGLKSLLTCGDSLVAGKVVAVLLEMNDPRASKLLEQHGQQKMW